MRHVIIVTMLIVPFRISTAEDMLPKEVLALQGTWKVTEESADGKPVVNKIHDGGFLPFKNG